MTSEQVGTEIVPQGSFLCEFLGDGFCQPSESPVYDCTYNTGSSNVAKGRKLSNSRDTHAENLCCSLRFAVNDRRKSIFDLVIEWSAV